MRKPTMPVPTRRVLFLVWLLVGALVIALTAATVVMLTRQNNQIDGLRSTAVLAKDDRADLRADLAKQQLALDAANAELINAGKMPVIPPPVATAPQILPPLITRYVPIPGPRGLRGLMGKTVVGPKGDSITGATGGAGPAGGEGKPGTDGKDGAAGKNGRGIESTTCSDDGMFVIHYDDGTAQTVDGSSCKAAVVPPPPEPTPAPAP